MTTKKRTRKPTASRGWNDAKAQIKRWAKRNRFPNEHGLWVIGYESLLAFIATMSPRAAKRTGGYGKRAKRGRVTR